MMNGVHTPIDRIAVDQLVASFAIERHCPSIAWGIVRHGELEVHGSTGEVQGRTPDEHTVYRIASMTKSFSAAVTLLLRDEGTIALDAPIEHYAPELTGVRSPTADAPSITVRDLLCMSSGLVNDDPWADRHLDLTDDEFDEIIRDGLVFAHPTGACHEYSNFGFALLGRVIHRATGTRLRELVSDRLLAPLGMSRTTWDQPDHDEWARPWRWVDDRFDEEISTPPDGMIAPMGGIWTTVADLAIWSAWLADAFPARDDPDGGPLARASRREMQTPQRYVGQRTLRGVRFPSSYGYGLRVLDEPDHGTVISHSGGLPGYGSNMRWTPGGSIAVVTVANVTYAPMTELGALIHDLLRDRGALHTSALAVDRDVERAGAALVDVLNAWADGATPTGLDDLFADNVLPDDDEERRSHQAAAHGALQLTAVRATSGGAGVVEATTPDGRRASVTFSLAPPRPPRIQDYEVSVTTATATAASDGQP
jgi:CubicO group peptidase (beta-lactamase class C family)